MFSNVREQNKETEIDNVSKVNMKQRQNEIDQDEFVE